MSEGPLGAVFSTRPQLAGRIFLTPRESRAFDAGKKGAQWEAVPARTATPIPPLAERLVDASHLRGDSDSFG